jgi:L-ascorbate metabolism protein UlaG (beta-lactamase superfamily)
MSPQQAPPPNALSALSRLTVTDGQVAVLWLGQSGFALRFNGATVLVDPFLSSHPDRLTPPAFDPADAHSIDVIACTHEHIDHLDLGALPALTAASGQAVVLVPEPIVPSVTGVGIDPRRIIGVQPGRTFKIRSLIIHALPASHGLKPDDAYNFGESISNGRVRYVGYVFQAPGISVYHAGDTIDYPTLAASLRDLGVSVALLPINGRSEERAALDIVGNLDADEAVGLATRAGVRTLVPMHYDMFANNLGDPERVLKTVRLNHSRLQVQIPDMDKPFLVG